MSTVSTLDLAALAQGIAAPVSETCWYAIQTFSQHEKVVRDRLRAARLEPFLPLSRQCRQWSDRKVWISVPLFAGYCFAKFALTERLAVLQVPGVVRIVGTMKPEPVQPEEIAALQRVVSTDRLLITPCDYLSEGIWVEVVRGPLAGLRGQFVRHGKRRGLVIRASVIQRATLIHLQDDEVIPLL